MGLIEPLIDALVRAAGVQKLAKLPSSLQERINTNQRSIISSSKTATPTTPQARSIDKTKTARGNLQDLQFYIDKLASLESQVNAIKSGKFANEFLRGTLLAGEGLLAFGNGGKGYNKEALDASFEPIVTGIEKWLADMQLLNDEIDDTFKKIANTLLDATDNLAEIGLAKLFEKAFNTKGIDTKLELQQLGNQVAFQIGDFLQQTGKTLILAGGLQELIDKALLALGTIGSGATLLAAGGLAYAAGTAIKAGARNRGANIGRFTGSGSGGGGSGNISNVGNPPTLSLNAPTSSTVVQPINLNLSGGWVVRGSDLITVINSADEKNVKVLGKRLLA